jgi:hypothetical protein
MILKATLAVVDLTVSVARQVSEQDAVDLVNEFGFMESAMPIVDPTAFRDHMKEIQQRKEVAAAFHSFRHRLQEILGDVEQFDMEDELTDALP